MIRPRITFADRVSHEFRTPLTVIKEYTALIRDGVIGDVSDEQQRMLRVVEDRADDLHSLVDNLLHHSQLGVDEQLAVRRSLPLADVLNRLRASMVVKCNLLGIEFDLDVNTSAICFADEDLLVRSLLNLTQFALRHRDPEATSLRLAVVTTSSETTFTIECCVEAAAGGGHGVDFAKVADLGLSVEVAEQLLQLQFGDLSLKVEGSKCRLIASIPADESKAIAGRYLDWLGAQTLAGETRVIALRMSSPEVAPLMARQLDGMLNYTAQATDLIVRLSADEWLIVTPSQQGAASFELGVEETRCLLFNQTGAEQSLTTDRLGCWPLDVCREPLLALL